MEDLQVKFTSTFKLITTVNDILKIFVKKFEDRIEETIDKNPWLKAIKNKENHKKT